MNVPSKVREHLEIQETRLNLQDRNLRKFNGHLNSLLEITDVVDFKSTNYLIDKLIL